MPGSGCMALDFTGWHWIAVLQPPSLSSGPARGHRTAVPEPPFPGHCYAQRLQALMCPSFPFQHC